MELDPLFLSRLQFAFVVAFHILFPAFTIGLASYLAVLEGLWLFRRREVYRRQADFWVKIFAVSFGMGVVSGIVMSYQFGTNWSRYSEITGNVLGPLFAYEVVTAFFLEATFLGILLFGRGRVPDGLHFTAALMVALGTLISAFWILSANSWMHTPAGAELRDGVFYPLDWWAIVFNPSFPLRFAHMVTACYLTTAFVVAGVSAWYLLKGRGEEGTRHDFSMALGLITVFAPMQIVIGDLHGLYAVEHQPAKVAALEGHWETQRGAPMILFAIPDEAAESNHLQIGIPKLGSFILYHDFDAEVHGLKEWAPEDRPPVPIVFFAFRIMVGIGLLMLFVALSSLALRWRGRLFAAHWFQRLCLFCLPIGFIALLAGWVTTEVGRQPWVVHELLRTSEAVTPTLTGASVAVSLATFILVYAAIFGAGTYYLVRLVQKGPQPTAPVTEPRTPKRPLSVPESRFEAE